MTTKTKKIISIVVGAIPGAMVLMSGVMKLTLNPKMVEGLTQGGFGPYIQLFGAIEIISLILFFVPRTKKIGFYLLISYLGGAMSVELAHGSAPVTVPLLILLWISFFLDDKQNFIKSNNA